MRKYATCDCETDPFKIGRVPEPFIWGWYDENGFRYFFDTKDFIDFLKDFEGIVYAHNGGKFDFYYLFEGLCPQEKVMIINGRIAKMKIGKAELRDSYLLFPVPLSAYKKDEIDYSLFEKETRFEHMQKIVEYLKGDCKYLYDLLTVQFSEYGQKLTLAGSAFDYWHANFNKEKFKPRSPKTFFEYFRKYYYGGRVQCFKKGIINEKFKVVDINSAYPYAMTFEHPYGESYKVSKTLPENFEQSFIQFRGKSNGVLPYREKGKLQFPNDDLQREYFATGWELKLGLEKGLVKIDKILRVTTFEKTINFETYVKHFFKLKADLKGKDAAKYLLAKLYLNSLYGKFGQSSLKHREYDLIEPQYISDYIENDGYLFEGELGDYALMSKLIKENRMRFFNVCTAASITGFVRSYLYGHILRCGKPLYCDTDSIAYSGSGDFRMGDMLGDWSLEGNFEKGAIGGKKLYAFKYEGKNSYKISSKGAKLNEKQIFAIANGKKVIYKSEAPTFSINKGPIFLEREITLT